MRRFQMQSYVKIRKHTNMKQKKYFANYFTQYIISIMDYACYVVSYGYSDTHKPRRTTGI